MTSYPLFSTSIADMEPEVASTGGLSDYEVARQEKIAENQRQMQALGLTVAAKEFTKLAPEEAKTGTTKKRKKMDDGEYEKESSDSDEYDEYESEEETAETESEEEAEPVKKAPKKRMSKKEKKKAQQKAAAAAKKAKTKGKSRTEEDEFLASDDSDDGEFESYMYR